MQGEPTPALRATPPTEGIFKRSMPQGGTPKDEMPGIFRGRHPLLGQGGADCRQELWSGWFEAVEDSEAQSSRKIPTTPAGPLGPASPPRPRRGACFQESSYTFRDAM